MNHKAIGSETAVKYGELGETSATGEPGIGPAARRLVTGAVIALFGDASRVVRRHWLVSALLAAGLALRVLVLMAYHPALLYVDSLKYLYHEWPGTDPLGYKALLRTVLAVADLGFVAVIQHLVGLAMTTALYWTLVRQGAARWLAAVAVAPVLLDAYQLQMEQMIMPDVWLEALIVAGLVVLLWQPAVTVRLALAAGLALGLSATFRQVGEVLVLPAVVYLLAASGGWRLAAGRAAALSAAFALPILLYCSASYAVTGHFWLARSQGSAPGRLAAAADCATLRLPTGVRPICPTPAEQAHGPDWLLHSGSSPLKDAAPPPGMGRAQMLSVFESAVERQQPLRVAGSVLRDAARLFSVTRGNVPGVTPVSRWQFQVRYPTHHPEIRLGRRHVILIGQHRGFGQFYFRRLNPSYGGAAEVDRLIAAFLRVYQLDGGYTPGPLLALSLLAGLACSAIALARHAGHARKRQLALACLLFTVTAVTVLLASDWFEFSWRYQLPALVTLPPAGALGIAALLTRPQAAQPQGERIAHTPNS